MNRRRFLSFLGLVPAASVIPPAIVLPQVRTVTIKARASGAGLTEAEFDQICRLALADQGIRKSTKLSASDALKRLSAAIS